MRRDALPPRQSGRRLRPGVAGPVVSACVRQRRARRQDRRRFCDVRCCAGSASLHGQVPAWAACTLTTLSRSSAPWPNASGRQRVSWFIWSRWLRLGSGRPWGAKGRRRGAPGTSPATHGKHCAAFNVFVGKYTDRHHGQTEGPIVLCLPTRDGPWDSRARCREGVTCAEQDEVSEGANDVDTVHCCIGHKIPAVQQQFRTNGRQR